MKATSHATTGHPNERSEHSKRHTGISVIGAALLLSVAFVNQAAAQAPYYNVQWLGSFFGSDMNDKGQVAGFILVNGGTTHAALYSDGKITDLGVLTGGSQSEANGINNNGVVVGWSETTDVFTRHETEPERLMNSRSSKCSIFLGLAMGFYGNRPDNRQQHSILAHLSS